MLEEMLERNSNNDLIAASGARRFCTLKYLDRKALLDKVFLKFYVSTFEFAAALGKVKV
jgi:hypothetical protein